LEELCDQHGLALIDDAAHAFPAIDWTVNDLVGSGKHSKATFFSFYATKTITTGEGGMITTNDDALAGRIRKLRLHGFNKELFDRYTNAAAGWRYDISEPGWKANMTDIAAALGIGQLHRAVEMRERRWQIAQAYFKQLEGVPGVKLPEIDEGSAWHLFPIQVEDRDEFVRRMTAAGIQCSVHFIPLHQHSYWQKALGVKPGDFPNADALFAGEVSLPIYSLMTDDDARRVCFAVETILRG
jgi:dTDP-4-amino-4,6-dideoxygalactose transaminase